MRRIKSERCAYLYVGKSKLGGRGVFADQPIERGATIEIAPVLVGKKESGPTWDTYAFQWGATRALGLGYTSLYNHSRAPNAKVFLNVKAGTIRVVARKNIKWSEEITINYNGDPRSRRRLAFESC